MVATGGLGAGKTALLTTTRELAARRGCTVLAARGSYLERELPFGLVSRLFVCVRPGEEVQHLPRIAAALGQSDTLAEPGPVTLPELPVLHRALARMAAERPVAIVVDDAQWADQPSLQWLSTLPHRIEHLPVFALAGSGAGEGCKMNREIADALFVQLRTVEIHLTKVYRKLGIDGRDQLAPALRLVG
ncbi:hypothetical protein GCM10022267_52640 [Lentzea roselyniae]|uniref:HTH luxR-type domain-containing protein n=1 Tax=Lentzea roselyniae TaxID=531940 RepID=A0ABP7BI88_9PSEU